MKHKEGKRVDGCFTINSNIGCIETNEWQRHGNGNALINSNIGCIETVWMTGCGIPLIWLIVI